MDPLSTGDPLRLGPYRLLGVLGAGGMGKVYLGRDGQGQPAALKVLRPELAHDQQMVQRFLREAQAAQAVTGKGVARVLGAQTEGGRQWIASEFLAGPTLDQAVRQYGPLPESAVRVLAGALAATLGDVHAAGLVHRDIKPSNIVLTSDGPRVIDFGIARPEHGLTLTSTGEAPATPGYGAPEQVLGQRTGPAGDIFALGAVLAYAASGRNAFTGGHVAAVQYEVVHGEPDLSAVPGALRQPLAYCLAKDPAARPAPAWLARALTPPRRPDLPWKNGPLAVEINQREEHARRLAEVPGVEVAGVPRRRLLGAFAAGGAVLLAGGGGALWWAVGGEEVNDGPQPWAAEPLSTYAPGTVPEPLWSRPDVASAKAPAPLAVRDVVVVAAPSGVLRAYGVTDGKHRWTSPPTATETGALEAPDGVVLVVASDGSLLALDAADGKQAWSVRGADAERLLAADDAAVYVLTGRGRIRAIDLEEHTVRWTAPAPVAITGAAVGAAAEDERLVLHGVDGRVAALETGRGGIAWGPRKQGGKALVPAVGDGTVYLGGSSLTALSLRSGAKKWREPGSGEDGFGAPAVSGGSLYIAQGGDLSVRRTKDGSEAWTLPMNLGKLSVAPPVTAGRSVWLADGEESENGISTADTRSGVLAWSYTPGTRGDWHLATADNRVFLLQAGTLTAMPVF